jgi:hypothetical protein
MAMLTTKDVAAWIHRRGGLLDGLPRLRSAIKSGRVSAAEIEVVKEYLANLDTTQVSADEQHARESRKHALATTLNEAVPANKPGSTLVVALVAIAAALAAAVIVR